METIGVTESLESMMVRQGWIARPAGTGSATGIKGAGVSDGRDGPQVAAANRGSTGEEERSGLKLVWVNPTAMAKTAKRGGHPAVLAMIVCKQ